MTIASDTEQGAPPQPAAADETASTVKRYSLTGELQRAATSSWKRAQTGVYPVIVGGALEALASGMHQDHGNPLLGVAVPAGAFAVALAVSKVRGWLAKEPWRRVWAGGCLAAAAAWTSTAAAVGADMSTLMPGVLVVGGSLLAAPWWWANRWTARKAWEGLARKAAVRPHDETTEEVQQVEASPERPALEAGPHAHQLRWDATLGQERDLAGTHLEQGEQLFDHRGDPNGLAWIVNGTDARVSWQTMFRNLGAVYAAYDGPGVDGLVHLEREPERWETRTRLVLLERNPLLQSIEWERPGLDPATGTIPFAVYPDGSGWAPYTLFVPDWGTPHDQVIGETGSGKGGALRLIAIESLVFGSRLILFDPHGNGALEDATGLIRAPLVSPQEMLAGAHAIEAALEERILIRTEVGKHRFGPEFGHNPLHVMADEATKVFTLDREIARIMSRVYREGRKFWVKGTLADQSTAFGDYLGNQGTVIRGQAQGGSSILYRVAPEEARRTNPGVDLPVPLHRLPQWINEEKRIRFTGLGYVLGSTARVLNSRTQWVPDSAFAAWCPPIERQVLDDRTEEAFQRAFDAAMGRMTGDEGERSQPPSEPDGGSKPGTVTELYPEADRASDERAAERLLEFIGEHQGEVTRAQISDAGICSIGQAHRVLIALESSKRIESPDRGVYTLRAS